jgi:uncharacterized protein
MLTNMLAFLRLRPDRDPDAAQRQGRFARWIGRRLAHLHYAVTVEPTWLEVNEIELPIRGLPASFSGLRVAHLTDFHGGHQISTDYLHEAVDLTHAQNPDLIALTGDFIHKGDVHIERTAAALSRLRAPLGVFAVLGNHDYSVRNPLGVRRYPDLHVKVADALSEHGIRVLRNESVPLRRADDTVQLVGIEDLWSGVCDPVTALGGVGADSPRLVLAHNPLTIEKVRNQRCDLMLSGHTHGGQVMLPGVGRLALSPRGRRFAAGLYRVGSSYLYVNKGVGFGLRIRYRVRPEVAVFTLIPEARDER